MDCARMEVKSMARKRNAGREPKNCIFCNSKFLPITAWQKFCKPKCHNEYWTSRRSNPDDRFLKIEARLDALELQGKSE